MRNVDDGFAVVAAYEDEQRARADAAALVESGVGVDLRPASGDAEGPGTATVELWALQGDLARAREVLGLPAPEVDEVEDPRKYPWKTILAIWLAAMVALPLFAFWFTYSVMG